MATSFQGQQWRGCLQACQLCTLTAEGFEKYMSTPDARTLECLATWSDWTCPPEYREGYTALVESRRNGVQNTSIPDLRECYTATPVDHEETVDMRSMSETETDSADEDADDVWSIVSDDESIIMRESKCLLSGAGDAVDEQREVGDDNDGNEEDGEAEVDAKDEELSFEEHNRRYLQFVGDDCTEEGIRLAEMQKQLEACRQECLSAICKQHKAHREELDELKRRHQVECTKERKRTEDARHQRKVLNIRILGLEAEIREREEEYTEEWISMQRETEQKLENHYQESINLHAALELAREHHRQDAATNAKLCAEAAKTLSDEIKKAKNTKASLEKTLEHTKTVHNAEMDELHDKCCWFEDKLEEASAKEQNDHAAHLKTRNQLAKAEDEVKELKQKKQELISGNEELQRQHEQQVARLMLSYDQELVKAKEEHEQDNAAHHDYHRGFEADMDELVEKKDWLLERLGEKYQDLEISYDHDMSEAKEKIEHLQQSLRTVSDELKVVKDEKAQLDKDKVEVESTMEELCQQMQDSEARHEWDRREAARDIQCLERAVRKRRGELQVMEQENKEMREQLEEAKKAAQGLQETQQVLVSRCTADRMMVEKSLATLRELLQQD
jgi:hypothetical protein